MLCSGSTSFIYVPLKCVVACDILGRAHVAQHEDLKKCLSSIVV